MKGYGIIYTILFCLFGCLMVSATQPTKPRMIVDNKPATIDHEIADIYRAMARLPLIQYQGLWVHGRGGCDTATITFPQPFKDTLYRVSILLADSIETGGNESAHFSIMNKTTSSCFFTGIFIDDSTNFDVIAVGERP